MKLKAFIGGIRRNNHTREAGWTFGEVLIVVGVIAALAIAGFVVYTQTGQSMERNQLAGQVADRIGSESRMISSFNRDGMSMTQVAAMIATLIQDHPIFGGTATVTAAGDAGSTGGTTNCTATGFGVAITVDAGGDFPDAFDEAASQELRAAIEARINDAVDDWQNTFNQVSTDTAMQPATATPVVYDDTASSQDVIMRLCFGA